jgi:hypothetical protein
MSICGKRIFAAAGVLVVLITASLLQVGAGAESAGPRTAARGVFVSSNDWKATCSGGCDPRRIASASVTTPKAAVQSTLVLTASLTIRISRGDAARIGVNFSPADTPGAMQPMPPGTIRVGGTGMASVVTFTWLAAKQTAASTQYYAEVVVSLIDADGDGRATASGSERTTRFEVQK